LDKKKLPAERNRPANQGRAFIDVKKQYHVFEIIQANNSTGRFLFFSGSENMILCDGGKSGEGRQSACVSCKTELSDWLKEDRMESSGCKRPECGRSCRSGEIKIASVLLGVPKEA
jgi:hypothetical protein